MVFFLVLREFLVRFLAFLHISVISWLDKLLNEQFLQECLVNPGVTPLFALLFSCNRLVTFLVMLSAILLSKMMIVSYVQA